MKIGHDRSESDWFRSEIRAYKVSPIVWAGDLQYLSISAGVLE
jgi:hypothetical protein